MFCAVRCFNSVKLYSRALFDWLIVVLGKQKFNYIIRSVERASV